jgi:hypothetical protein
MGPFCAPITSYIALQAESHPCEFRNIELRVLKKPAKR